MDSRVTLRSPGYNRRPSGEEVPTQGSAVGTCWAAVRTISGSKSWREQQVQPGLTHEVEIRYRPGVAADWFLDWEGRLLHITAVLEVGRKENLVLLCAERADGVRD